MSITSKQIRYLKSKAHHLNPIAFVGKEGVTSSVIASVQQTFKHHELIKVKFTGHKTEKLTLAPQLATATESALIGILGHIALLYRPHPEKPILHLPE